MKRNPAIELFGLRTEKITQGRNTRSQCHAQNSDHDGAD
jgi:hypothetical protein